MNLWLDAKTLLPLKSVVVIRIENMHITETYREFKLDPKIDAKAFMLVPQVNEAEKLFRAVEKKLNTAKAVQVTVEYAAKTKGKEEKFKGSLLFTKEQPGAAENDSARRRQESDRNDLRRQAHESRVST